jgi:hypothetical protein
VSAGRPASDIDPRIGLVGAVVLVVLLYATTASGTTLGTAAVVLFLATALSMIAAVVILERPLHPEPGHAQRIGRREAIAVAAVKFVGLATTFLLLYLIYRSVPWYGQGGYRMFVMLFEVIVPALLLVAPAYLFVCSFRMTDPRDGLWHFGALLCFRRAEVKRGEVLGYLRSWMVKGFFLPFMISILVPALAHVRGAMGAETPFDPVALVLLLIGICFLFDVFLGTIGYVFALRILGSHIRSSNPYVTGWVAALACYPPFALMQAGGPLDYRVGAPGWTTWLADQPLLLAVWGAALVALAAIYAWATVIFGIRFSNLTYRGIVTGGPYRWFKHPAYAAKNLFWWLAHVPFVPAMGAATAAQNVLLLLSVNLIYLLRARTEEWHLMSDPKYQAYSDWIARNGVLGRTKAALRRVLARVRPDGAPRPASRSDPA